ncbi:MAG: ABC transporter ATP-binding protein [Phycisphaerales bacterium]|nr:MAG: ABC transporter ATP-binding protein [Phycisphaerales bacterium]
MTEPARTDGPLLRIEDLRVSFANPGGPRLFAVNGAGLSVFPGQTLAVVGESGCGKSMTALSVLGLVPRPNGRIDSGRILYNDGRSVRDLRTLDERSMRRIRGGEIAMIFQEPMTSLNPVFTIGEQITEAVRLHQRVGRAEALAISGAALRDVGIPDPERRMRAYPHQFSGGMRQRVMIAMALACEPRLLLADEPTTALDVTIQAQILELLRAIQRDRGMGMILITHALGVVAENADAVCVMYAGRVVEYAEVHELFDHPMHPYTRGLLACIPGVHTRRERLTTIRETVEAPGAFAPLAECPDGACPWWPHTGGGAPDDSRTGPAEGGYGLIEVRPGHWVGVRRESGSEARSVLAPELRHRRDGAIAGPLSID